MHNEVLEDIIDYRTIGVIVIDSFTLSTSDSNSLGRYRYRIYCYLNSVFNMIAVFETYTNSLPVTNKKPDNLWKRNHK